MKYQDFSFLKKSINTPIYFILISDDYERSKVFDRLKDYFKSSMAQKYSAKDTTFSEIINSLNIISFLQ